uniref:PIN domain-containing protein n=1 Tax=Alexandrium monilatum TaxID=311494 RepID=A0A7S4Q0D9_9DINO
MAASMDDDLSAGLAAYAQHRGAKAPTALPQLVPSPAVFQAGAFPSPAAPEAQGQGRRFRWPSAEPLVPAVVAQNLPAGLDEPPAPLLAAFEGRVRSAKLVAGSGPCRKGRDCLHLELEAAVPLSQLGDWQSDVRSRLRLANGVLQERADAVEIVPGRMELGAASEAVPGLVVVDTDAISMLFKGDTRGQPLKELLGGQARKLVAFQTVAELHAWILLRHFPAARIRKLEELLSDFEVVWPDDLACLLWAQLMDYGRAHGRPAGPQDCWVAATALRHGASLCTVNLKDYDYLPGLRFLAPAPVPVSAPAAFPTVPPAAHVDEAPTGAPSAAAPAPAVPSGPSDESPALAAPAGPSGEAPAPSSARSADAAPGDHEGSAAEALAREAGQAPAVAPPAPAGVRSAAAGAALARRAPSGAGARGGARGAAACAAVAGLLAAAAGRRLHWRFASLAVALVALLRVLVRGRRTGGRLLRGSRAPEFQRLAEDGPFTAAQLAKISVLDAFLRRLARSPQREAFVLRGSLLTRQLVHPAVRNSDDLDFLALFPWEETGAEVEARVRSVLAEHVDDGVCFDLSGIVREIIWEETDSPGVRLTVPAKLDDGQRFQVQVDVAFNDPIQPAPAWLTYAPVLGGPFTVLAVTAETMFGWKLHGLFERNRADEDGREQQGLWRPKDLHDLLMLVRSGRLDTAQLPRAINVSFHSRGSSPELTLRLVRKTFGISKGSQRLWRQFREKHLAADGVPEQLHEAVGALGDFLKPVLERITASERNGNCGAGGRQALQAEDETATVTVLPGKADVAKFAKKVEVTDDLEGLGLLSPGSAVRFCGRADEFEVEAVRAPRRRAKRGPDGAEVVVEHRGFLTLRKPPYFTAKACTVELVSRRPPATPA